MLPSLPHTHTHYISNIMSASITSRRLPALVVAAKDVVAALRLFCGPRPAATNTQDLNQKEIRMHACMKILCYGCRFMCHSLLTALALVIQVQSDRLLRALTFSSVSLAISSTWWVTTVVARECGRITFLSSTTARCREVARNILAGNVRLVVLAGK